jgi:hypothetical protein
MSFDRIRLAQRVARILPTEWAILAEEFTAKESRSDAIDSLTAELRYRYMQPTNSDCPVESYLLTEVMSIVDWQYVAKSLIYSITTTKE